MENTDNDNDTKMFHNSIRTQTPERSKSKQYKNTDEIYNKNNSDRCERETRGYHQKSDFQIIRR